MYTEDTVDAVVNCEFSRALCGALSADSSSTLEGESINFLLHVINVLSKASILSLSHTLTPHSLYHHTDGNVSRLSMCMDLLSSSNVGVQLSALAALAQLVENGVQHYILYLYCISFASHFGKIIFCYPV